MNRASTGRSAFLLARPIILAAAPLEIAPSNKPRDLELGQRAERPSPRQRVRRILIAFLAAVAVLRICRRADGSRRYAELSLKAGRKRALIGEAVAQRNFGNRALAHLLISQIRARAFEPPGADLR